MQSNVIITRTHKLMCGYLNCYILYTQIADFGMSRNLLDENYYITSGGKIPVKWTAPEVGIYKGLV